MMNKWFKKIFTTTLIVGLILLALPSETLGQKLYFPTNVRYIAGGYINKLPYYRTLEAALNQVKPFATVNNPYVFWIDSDTLQIADWDSVFTESGLTMKDSINLYYVAVGKIKWAGFGQGSGGTGTTVVIPTQTETTTHYDYPNWDKSNSALALWIRYLAQATDSIDQHIWDLIVYTDSVYLYIENDTLKFRVGSLSSSGWNPDTTTVLRTTGNQSKSGTFTMVAGMLFGVNGYLQLPAANYGPGSNIWRANNNIYWYTGADSLLLAMIDISTGEFLNTDVVGYPALTDAVIDSINQANMPSDSTNAVSGRFWYEDSSGIIHRKF